MKCAIAIVLLACLMVGCCDSKSCYDITCFSENCLQEAIDANSVQKCQMNEEYGCSFLKMTSGTVMIVAECSSTECSSYHSAPEQENLCCKDDLCNTGTHIPDDSSTTHCHSYMCTSGWDCLQNGISSNYSRTCPMDPQYGCFVLKSRTGSVTSVNAGCLDHTCREFYTTTDATRSENTCCTGNMCNDGTSKQEPAQTRCHSYVRAMGWECLEEGISSNLTGTCPMDPQYGCFVHKSQAGSVTSVSAGCSDHTCRSFYSQAGDNKDDYKCCTGNLCNEGNINGGFSVSPHFSTTMIPIIVAFVWMTTLQ